MFSCFTTKFSHDVKTISQKIETLTPLYIYQVPRCIILSLPVILLFSVITLLFLPNNPDLLPSLILKFIFSLLYYLFHINIYFFMSLA